MPLPRVNPRSRRWLGRKIFEKFFLGLNFFFQKIKHIVLNFQTGRKLTPQPGLKPELFFGRLKMFNLKIRH